MVLWNEFPASWSIGSFTTREKHTHCCSKFNRYGICLLRHLAAHVKAYLGDFARSGWSSWGLSLILRHEMLGSALDSGSPFSSHSATRDRLSFHSAFLLLRPCLRQDNSPRWTTVFWQGEKIRVIYLLRLETLLYVWIDRAQTARVQETS